MIEEQQTRLVPIGQVVARLQEEYPDVSPSSLRFLEREGLVEPERTPGGHRLYSEEHINQVRRIKEWQRERLSLAEIRERLQAAAALPDYAEIARSFVERAAAGDSAQARQVILRAHDAGMPVDEIYDTVLRPALYEVGRRWQSGELTVGQEHEVTAIVRDLIGEMSSRSGRPPQPEQVVLAACVAGETHDLGLRMVAHLLESRGHAVHYLGADVPVDSILEGIRMRGANLVLLSTTIEENVPSLLATLDAINSMPESERPVVVAGGQILADFEEDVRTRGAELFASMPFGSARIAEGIAHLLNG